MIGKKIYKTDITEYKVTALWCNSNNATIIDCGDHYEVVSLLPTLEEIKQNKIASLKAERDALEVEPIEYTVTLTSGDQKTYPFDYDDKARDRINAAIISLEMAGEGVKLSWTTADQQEAMVGIADLKGIIGAVALRSNDLHIRYRTAKEKVMAAFDEAEVEAVTL